MEENVKNQLDQLNTAIDSKIEKAKDIAVEASVVQADEIVKSQVSEMTTKFNDRLDAIEVSNKKTFDASQPRDFKSALGKALLEGAIDALTKGNSRSASFQIKADMTTGADFSGEVIPADRVPGYFFDPTRPVHVRSFNLWWFYCK